MIMPGHGGRLGFMAGAAPPAFLATQTQDAYQAVAATTHSFTHTVDAGTTHLVVACSCFWGGVNAGVITDISWNGVSMTQDSEVAITGGGQSSDTAIYSMANPTTGAHSVQVTTNIATSHLESITAYNLTNTTALATQGTDIVASGNALDVTLTTSNPTAVIGIVTMLGASAQSTTWTNLTEDRDDQNASTRSVATASTIEANPVTSKTYTATGATAPTLDSALCVAAYK